MLNKPTGIDGKIVVFKGETYIRPWWRHIDCSSALIMGVRVGELDVSINDVAPMRGVIQRLRHLESAKIVNVMLITIFKMLKVGAQSL